MEKRPKVSVVIPIYNVENYLSRCLESVIHQTLLDIEIIGVNDGTKDNSVAVSYTHLDVYKRQVQKYLNKQKKEAEQPLNNAFAEAFAKLNLKE